MGQGSSRGWGFGITVLFGAALTVGAAAGLARAQGTATGTGMILGPTGKVTSAALEFRQWCASCHGPKGKGDGPAVVGLSTKPPDLTLLSKSAGGVFPEQVVKDVLNGGGKAIAAHGSAEMPVWGTIFRTPAKGAIGQPHFTPQQTAARIQRIVNYLEEIQEK